MSCQDTKHTVSHDFIIIIVVGCRTQILHILDLLATKEVRCLCWGVDFTRNAWMNATSIDKMLLIHTYTAICWRDLFVTAAVVVCVQTYVHVRA